MREITVYVKDNGQGAVRAVSRVSEFANADDFINFRSLDDLSYSEPMIGGLFGGTMPVVVIRDIISSEYQTFQVSKRQ